MTETYREENELLEAETTLRNAAILEKEEADDTRGWEQEIAMDDESDEELLEDNLPEYD